MKKITALLLAILLLLYGLVRIGVGAGLLAYSLDWIYLPELAEASVEVGEFFSSRQDRQLIYISNEGYFGYIMLMGAALTAGAIGVMKRVRWGYAVLVSYLIMHLALFVNYLEVNPKVLGLAFQAGMIALLFYLRPPVRANTHPAQIRTNCS